MKTKPAEKKRSRIRITLLILVWVWAACVALVLDLFFNVDEFDAIRPRNTQYQAMRNTAHRLVGEPLDSEHSRGTVSRSVDQVPGYVPQPPPQYRGTNVQWKLTHTESTSFLRNLLQRTDELSSQELMTLLQKVKFAKDSELAGALIEIDDRVPDTLAALSAYSFACCATLMQAFDRKKNRAEKSNSVGEKKPTE